MLYNDEKMCRSLFRIMTDSLMKECHVINEMAFSVNLWAYHGFEISAVHSMSYGMRFLHVL